jgi:hypothetical protein
VICQRERGVGKKKTLSFYGKRLEFFQPGQALLIFQGSLNILPGAKSLSSFLLPAGLRRLADALPAGQTQEDASALGLPVLPIVKKNAMRASVNPSQQLAQGRRIFLRLP